jgi:vacuolar protein sorting-associated protein 45
MIANAAEEFPPSIYGPLISTTTTTTSAPPSSSATPTPGLNLRAGGYELSVGGAAGSGLYRASGNNEVGASFQIPPQAQQVAEGIRDGAGRLWGNVMQRVEERVSRAGTPQAGR